MTSRDVYNLVPELGIREKREILETYGTIKVLTWIISSKQQYYIRLGNYKESVFNATKEGCLLEVFERVEDDMLNMVEDIEATQLPPQRN